MVTLSHKEAEMWSTEIGNRRNVGLQTERCGKPSVSYNFVVALKTNKKHSGLVTIKYTDIRLT